MGIPRPHQPSLSTLPEDVHLQILDLLPPAQIAAFAHLCHATNASAAAPEVWASVARRHLALVPPTRPTATEVARLARSLLSRWWICTGLFVPGVPVHRRSGFAAVRTRGGIEVPLPPSSNSENSNLVNNNSTENNCNSISSDTDFSSSSSSSSTDTAYVFAGRHANRCTPTALPAVELDFALDPAGPFPVDGLTLRLQHAAEISPQSIARAHSRSAASSSSALPTVENKPVGPDAPPSSTSIDAEPASEASPSSPTQLEQQQQERVGSRPAAAADSDGNDDDDHSQVTADQATSILASASSSASAASAAPDFVRVRVELNNTVVSVIKLDPSRDFSTFHIHLPANLLVSKPGLNMLAVRFDRDSTTGYWLRDVTVCPTVLPLPRLTRAVVPAPPRAIQAPAANSDPAAAARRWNRSSGSLASILEAARAATRASAQQRDEERAEGEDAKDEHQHQQHRDGRSRRAADGGRGASSAPRDIPGGGRRGERQRGRAGAREEYNNGDGRGASPFSSSSSSSTSSSASASGSTPSSPRAVHRVESAGLGSGRANKGKTPGAKARTPKHKYHQHQHHLRSPRSPRARFNNNR